MKKSERKQESVLEHVFLEEVHNGLLPDISIVDYTRGNFGKTKLEKISDMFVDRIFVCTCAEKESYSVVRGRFYSQNSTLLIREVAALAEKVFGKKNYVQKFPKSCR